MSDESEKPIEPSQRRVLSFKAVVVMTQNDGFEPTLKSVEQALYRSGLAFTMPADPSGAIVISVNDSQ